jgi:hypothetical protein
MNITYQIGMRGVESNFKKAVKPIKVLHFHPHKPNLLETFMYGENPLMSKRLIDIFHQHDITDMHYLSRV